MSDTGETGSKTLSVEQKSMFRLAAIIFGSIALATIFDGFSVLIVVLALVTMVMLHEFGHFITAKLSGMKVTEFFLGFGPRLWSIRRGETEYGIKLIPAGGYVRIVGMSPSEVVAPEDEARSFRQATFPRRVLVAVAGSFMHIVMAFVLLFALFAFSGFPTPKTAYVTSLTNFVGVKSPAISGGMRPGDKFVSINGHTFSDPLTVSSYITARPGVPLNVVVSRNGRLVHLLVRPDDRRDVKVATTKGPQPLAKASAKPSGVIGVGIGFLTANMTTNPIIAVQRAGSMLVSVTGQTFSGMAQVFSIHGLSSFTHSVVTAGQHSQTSSTSSSFSSSSTSSNSSEQLLSIYGAVQIGAHYLHQNVSVLLYLLVAINLFVGFINLFPMLPLDGGHVVVAVYERIRSRRGNRYHADVNKLAPVIVLFVAFILIMGLGALYANIVDPVSLTGR